MAQQIIITKDNYGIDLSCVFLDSKKKPIDITGMNVEVVITNPNDVIIDTIQATIINPIGGYSSIVINNEHTNIVGLYKTFWTLLDSDGRVTAQEDVYYYVKDKNGGSGDYSSESTFDIESVKEKFNELDSSIVTIEGNIDTLKSNVSYINSNITLLDTKIDGVDTKLNSKIDSVKTELDGKINTTNLNVSGLDTRITKTETEIEEIKNVNVNAEVVEARQGKARLVDNIQEIKTNLELTNEEISSLEFNKVDKVEGKQLSTNDFDNRLKQLVEDWNNFKSNGGEIGNTISYPKGVTRQLQQQIEMRSKDYTQRMGLSNYNGYPCWSAIIEDPENDNNTNGLLLMLGTGSGDAYNDNYLRPLKMGYAQKNNIGSTNVPWDNIFLTGSSKSTNGYTKLPNGMILQWGTKTVNVAVNDSGTSFFSTITFPIEFPTKMVSKVLTSHGSISESPYPPIGTTITETSYTTSSIQVKIGIVSANNTAKARAVQIDYFVIGY